MKKFLNIYINWKEKAMLNGKKNTYLLQKFGILAFEHFVYEHRSMIQALHMKYNDLGFVINKYPQYFNL